MRPCSFLAAVSACITLCVGTVAPSQAADPVQRIRVVGGLAGVHQYTRHEEPFWTRSLSEVSGGRLSADIVPFDRAGILPQEMLRLVRLGVVPFGTALITNSGADDPELLAPDLAGLSPDIESLRRTVDAVRPRLTALLAERHGIELLAVYSYPAQVLFCREPIGGLPSLAGRRVRVSGVSQADFMAALGATPVQTTFGEVMDGMVNGNLDCAITGTMSGYTIGLHTVTRYVHTMPISWGLSAFVANGAAWRQLGAPTQALLRDQLKRLERAIWAESADETREGIACSAGGPACTKGPPGRLVAVQGSTADLALRRRILVEAVVPAWIRRCGDSCAAIWRGHLASTQALSGAK